MLSEERIMEIAECCPVWYAIPQGREKALLTEFARAIEREVLKEAKVQVPTITMEQEFAWHQRQGFIRGHRQGQERMRERAASQAAEEAGEHGTDSDGWYICKSLSHQIEELEIEEPK